MDELEILANSRARMKGQELGGNQAHGTLGNRTRLATGSLFLICLFSFPCFYFVVLVVGIAPLSVIAGLAVLWLSPGSGGSGLVLGLLSLVNVVVWSVIVFLTCRWAVRAIYARFTKAGDFIVGALLLTIAAVGLLPFFWVAGHGTPVGTSAYALFFEIVTSA
jgi:hypothetical protein